MTCHQNSLESGNTSLGFAPALVARKYKDGHLASILLRPEAVWRARAAVGAMPNLGLQPDEVTALVAFIDNLGTAMAAGGWWNPPRTAPQPWGDVYLDPHVAAARHVESRGQLSDRART